MQHYDDFVPPPATYYPSDRRDDRPQYLRTTEMIPSFDLGNGSGEFAPGHPYFFQGQSCDNAGLADGGAHVNGNTITAATEYNHRGNEAYYPQAGHVDYFAYPTSISGGAENIHANLQSPSLPHPHQFSHGGFALFPGPGYIAPLYGPPAASSLSALGHGYHGSSTSEAHVSPPGPQGNSSLPSPPDQAAGDVLPMAGRLIDNRAYRLMLLAGEDVPTVPHNIPSVKYQRRGILPGETQLVDAEGICIYCWAPPGVKQARSRFVRHFLGHITDDVLYGPFAFQPGRENILSTPDKVDMAFDFIERWEDNLFCPSCAAVFYEPWSMKQHMQRIHHALDFNLPTKAKSYMQEGSELLIRLGFRLPGKGKLND